MKSIFSASILNCALMVFFSSCQKEPTACFTTEKSEYVKGEVVKFVNCSEDATEYEWDFGDGESATISDPTHEFTETGTYSVSLKTISKNGKKSDNTSSSLKVSIWKLENIKITSETEYWGNALLKEEDGNTIIYGDGFGKFNLTETDRVAAAQDKEYYLKLQGGPFYGENTPYFNPITKIENGENPFNLSVSDYDGQPGNVEFTYVLE